ncbi:MAG: hypothetical protein PHG90_01175 [Clostridia bacterium]|nr:hypothetical protein [Clostridia bacterium]
MKKTLTLIVILVIACLVSIFVSACDGTGEEDIFPPATYEINNEEDFCAISEKTGKKYSNATFLLKNDLDLSSSNWIGIGSSPNISDAFTGVFDGDGHSITYSASFEPPTENVFEPDERQAFGLFQYANNATFKNLSLIVNLLIPCEAENIYVGGLCAYLSGDSSVEDVTVSGVVETTIRDLRQDIIKSDGSIVKPAMGGQENNKYFDLCLGGVIGYSKGDLSYSNVASSVDINIGRNKYCILDNVNVGGIAGIIRPVDISNNDSARMALNNLSFEGSLASYGGNVYSGGIAGSINHSTINNIYVGNSHPSDFSGNALGRLSFGLVSGVIENSSLEKASVVAGTVSIASISTSKKVSFNLGGIAGMLKNSEISFCVAEISFEIRNGTYFYAGGIAGVCYDSDILSAVSEGGISIVSSGQIKLDIINYDFKYSMVAIDLADYSKNAKNGGIVGRVEGQCHIANLSSEFQAFQPLFGETANRLEIVILKKGESFLNEWIEDSQYDRNLMDISETVSKDAAEDEQQYTINHFYNVEDNLKLTYQESNAKVCIDRAEWQLAGRNLENTELGKAQNDRLAYDALKLSIETEMD